MLTPITHLIFETWPNGFRSKGHVISIRERTTTTQSVISLTWIKSKNKQEDISLATCHEFVTGVRKETEAKPG